MLVWKDFLLSIQYRTPTFWRMKVNKIWDFRCCVMTSQHPVLGLIIPNQPLPLPWNEQPVLVLKINVWKMKLGQFWPIFRGIYFNLFATLKCWAIWMKIPLNSTDPTPEPPEVIRSHGCGFFDQNICREKNTLTCWYHMMSAEGHRDSCYF